MVDVSNITGDLVGDVATGFVSSTVSRLAGCDLSEPIKCFQGDFTLIVAAVILFVLAFMIFNMLKNLVVNSIAGVAALLIIVYLFNVPIPMNGLVILVTVLGGVGGVGALLIATFFGWL